ncbi:hypothetical protein [Sphingomonas sp. 3-13AW]|uniref:hypothetical protein n=1 Tax=Sphingomonas sp. 3-13AW TaxID=3050450 RepID=UPI003BB6E73F
MKHSTLNKRLMLEWIHDCADAGSAMPTDAAIMERFGFGSEEIARTLLADLADAKSIQIRGAGRDREILLPESVVKPFRTSSVERLPRTVRRADPEVERLAALIVGARRAGGPTQQEQAPVPNKEPIMAKATTTRSAPPPGPSLSLGEALKDAGGSLDALFTGLLKRAEDAEAKAAGAASAEELAAALARAEAAEKKIAALKEMFA